MSHPILPISHRHFIFLTARDDLTRRPLGRQGAARALAQVDALGAELRGGRNAAAVRHAKL